MRRSNYRKGHKHPPEIEAKRLANMRAARCRPAIDRFMEKVSPERLRLVIRHPVYVRACCEYWGSVHISGGWYRNESPTGRLISGMSTRCRCVVKDAKPDCPLCDGTGRISGDLRDERGIEWRRCTAGCSKDDKGVYRIGPNECARCRGLGRRAILHRAVNPASIPATGFGKYEDVIYRTVNRTVSEWRGHDVSYWWAKVLAREYMFNGTQPLKARQMRVSLSWYEKKLHDAHYWVEVALDHA